MMKREIAEERGRLGYIDLARGLMLAILIAGHTQWAGWFQWCSTFDIPLFFVCSGYCTRDNFSLRKRIGKLAVAYIMMSVICLLYTLRYYESRIVAREFLGILYSRYYVYPPNPGVGMTGVEAGADVAWAMPYMWLFNSPLWFLTAMISSYTLYWVILRLHGFRPQLFACVVSIAIAWGCTLLPVLLPWSIDTAFYFAPFIWLGRELRERDLLQKIPGIGVLALLFICGMATWGAGNVNYSIRLYGNSFIFCLTGAAVGVILMMKLCRWEDRYCLLGIFRGLSREGLYVFGLQMMFIDFAMRYCRHFHAPESLYAPAEILMACAGGYLVGLLIDLVRNRIRN